ncbi:aldehyde dehydrogenase [Flagelloscypha sp. PMI_526]|nr:aldehyde dehydrogenase [Flagelloscypha sp. PMI_526]
MTYANTPLDEIPQIRLDLRKTFASGKTRSLEWRKHQLYQLARMVQDNADEFADAIFRDLGKPKQEVFLAETGPIIERCLIAAEKLESWAAPTKLDDVPDWQKAWNSTVYKAPKGTVLLIAPWNYPLILSLQPLYGAISAGCTAVIKPSEIAPNYAAILSDLLPKYLDTSAYRVVLGAIPEITRLLELQGSYNTGNGKIARIISAAAAKHLTPITLELGGKSPVFIADDADLKIAARRVLWGKINNAGQICVSPDFVIISRARQSDFVTALREVEKEFYPHGAFQSDSFGRIVSELHFKRITGLLDKTKGQIEFGGESKSDKLAMSPTVVKDVKDGDSLMSEELFGPVLPLVPVDSVAEGIDLLNSRDHPLVLYVFTKSQTTKNMFINGTMSGNLIFNDTFGQLASNVIPFGGVGESGHGRQVLKYSFDLFSYERASIDVPEELEPELTGRYPPYTAESLAFFAQFNKVKIPESSAP